MFKRKIIRRLLLIISFILLITSTINTTFGFVVTKTDTLINYFKPFEKIVNGLTISKTVEHPLGEDYVIPENIFFDFAVELGRLYSNTTLKTSAGNKRADEKGVLTLSVKPGQSVNIEGIDVDTKVTVTEIEKGMTGFAVKNNEAVKEVTIGEQNGAFANFINVYTPQSVQPLNVTLKGTKVLEGRKWQESDSFSFLLEQNVDGKFVAVGQQTVTYQEGKEDFNKFDFTNDLKKLTFTKVGKYAFRITEVIGKLENIDYDKTVNTFTITVTDTDMDGRLEIGNVESAQNAATVSTDAGFAVDVTFNNTFKPPAVIDDITVPVSVNKTVINKGEYERSPEGFEFILENSGTGEKTAFKTSNSGNAVTKLIFTDKHIGKELKYVLYEKKGDEKGVAYDTKVYDISVYVTLDEDNKLKTAITVNSQTVEKISVGFENICDMDKPDVPSTGSDRSVYIWMVLAVLSATACVILMIDGKKHRIN